MSADSSETPAPEESGARTPDDAAPGSAPTPQPHSDSAGHWIPPSLEHLQGLLPTYEFLEILGHGGMGAVYKARQLSLDRLVAIKILPPGIAAAGDNSFVERFKNEARTMAKMNHPGIVNVYDFGQTADGQLYLVMEYIDGTDVAKMVQSQGRLPQEYALAIAAHVCDALQYAHTHGVIHRDIKPANVLINMEGQVKVADFGLAKAKTRGAPQSTALTDANITMGTPDYVAPEALVMGMEPDHRADLYALGVMLYNMLTGEIPRGRFRPVSEKTGGDPRFDIIINKAMQERDARYQTALNMRRDLDVILTVPLAKSDATSSTIPRQFAQQNAIRKPLARRPSPAHAPSPPPPPKKSGVPVGLIVLALLAVGGFFAWKQFSKPNSTAGESDHLTNPAATGDAEQQIQQVVAELKRLNPDYDGAEKHSIEHGVVTAFHIDTTHVSNIAPLAALKGLSSLECAPPVTPADSDPGGRLQDLSPLHGLELRGLILRFNRDLADFTPIKGMPLESLHVGLTQFHDLDLLRGMPLKKLQIYRTPIHDLSALQGMALTELTFDETSVSDLTPLKGMPLTRLHFRNTQVTDLSLLRNMPLKDLLFSVNPARDYSLLASIKTLEILNDKPAADWFKNQPATASVSVGETEFTPVFGADGIRDWSQSAKGKWDLSGAVLLCQKNDKGTARLRCPKDFAPADFEIRFSVRGDHGPALEFRGSASDREDCYVCDPASVRTGGSIIWDEKKHGVFAKAGQRLKIAHDDQREELPKVTALPKWRDGDWNEVVLTVQGHHFTCACNGLIAAEYTDESPSYRAGPGVFGFRVTNITDGSLSVEFKDLRIRRLPAASSAPRAGITSYPQPPAWNDATASLRANLLNNGTLVADGEWLSISPKVQMPNLAPGKTFRNPIVRVRYSGRVDIALRRARREGEDVRYEAGIGAAGATLQITRVNGARVPSVKFGPSYRPSEEHEAVFAAQGSTMTLWIDGQNVTGMEDSSLPSGEIELLIKNDSNGTCRIKQVEYGELSELAAPSTNQPPVASTPREALVENTWTDVLPLVQLPRDLSEGKPWEGRTESSDWKLESGVLSASCGGFFALISPNLPVPESYDLAFRIKAASAKDSSLGVIVPVGDRQMLIHLQLSDFQLSGFETIDGKNAPVGSLTTIHPAVISKNVEQWVEVSVRSHEGRASVMLKVDGKPALDWAGKESSLSLWPTWKGRLKPHRLGLCATLGGATFRDVRLRRAEDTVVPPPAADANPPADKWTDWLAEQRRNGKLPKGLVEDGIGYKVTSDKFIVPLGPPMRDGAIRITGKRNTAPHFLLLLRCLEPGIKANSAASFSKAYRLSDDVHGLAMTYRDASAPDAVKIGEKLTDSDDGSKNHKIELRTVGNVVSVTYDDKLVLQTRDTRLTEGQPCLFAEPGAYFEKIEVLNLDGPRLPPKLLAQYTDALTRGERDAAHPEEKGAYNVELARLKIDPTLPLVDAPGTPEVVTKLRKIARVLLGGGR